MVIPTDKRLTTDDYEDGDFIEVQGKDVSDLQNDIDAQMNEIFAEFGGDPDEVEFSIRVYRAMTGRGELEYCFGCLPSELPIMERIRENFGAGKYEVRVYRNKKIFRRRTLNIAMPKKPVKQMEDLSRANDTKDLVAGLMEMQKSQFEQLQTIMAGQNRQPSQFEMMQSMLTLMASMKEAMGFNGPVSVQDPMKNFREGIDFAKDIMEMGGSGRDKDSTDVLLKAIDTFAPALIEGAKQDTSLNPPVSQPLKQNPTRPPNLTTEKKSMFEIVIQSQVKRLVGLASQGKDPELYAEVLLDQIPEQYIPNLNKFLNDPAYIAKLQEINPGVGNHADWFSDLKTNLLGMLSEPEEDLTTGIETANNQDHVPETDNPDNGDTASDT